MVSGLRNMTYEQRLQVLGLTTFETRMLRADLIQVLNLLHNIDHVHKDKFFTFAVDDRTGHAFQLYKDRLFQIGCATVGIICPMIL